MAAVEQITNYADILSGISSIMYILLAIFGLIAWIIKIIYGQFKKMNGKIDKINETLIKQGERLSIIETRLEERGHYDFRRTGTEDKKND